MQLRELQTGMQVSAALLVPALLAALLAAAEATWAAENPVQKVVNLLQDMKLQVEREADEDKAAHEKYACWCTLNKEAKSQATVAAEERITGLEAVLEEAAGLEAQLQTEIAGLEAGVTEDQGALDVAVQNKERETKAFQLTEKDTIECLSVLKQALAVLSKLQLLQHRAGPTVLREARTLLLQLKAAVEGVQHREGAFRGVMQRDLWDVVSSLGALAEGTPGDFLPPSKQLPPYRSRFSAIAQRGQLALGDAPPNGLVGAAAGATSYTARSGSIVGILSEMTGEFEKNLAADQKAELQALISFQQLRAAKVAEIAAGQGAAREKARTLAETLAKAAQGAEDLRATREALSAEQRFLLGLEAGCTSEERDYEKRTTVRTDELQALAETIRILSTDDARDLFIHNRGASLLQAASSHGREAVAGGEAAAGATAAGATAGRAEAEAARNAAIDRATRRILSTARQQRNWALASLAVGLRLDTFVKVREAMDKMTASLREQQKAETDRKDFCRQEIHQIESGLTRKGHEREDLEGQKLGRQNAVDTLAQDLEDLQKGIAEMKVSLKQAGENRAMANKVFQQAVSDQRATINILQKARARLAQFYTAALVQGGAHRQEPSQPGQPVAPPPPTGRAYEKNGGAGGVLQLLDKVLSAAANEESELVVAEQHSQGSYEALVMDINEATMAAQAAVVEKTKLSEEASAAKSEAEASLLANQQELMHLNHTLTGMHLGCDFVLKYFDVRQKARSEEITAIAEAKAILSGADFGKAVASTDAAES